MRFHSFLFFYKLELSGDCDKLESEGSFQEAIAS